MYVKVLELTFDGSTGRLSHMRNLLSGVQVAVDQQFLWWNSSAGNNVNSTQVRTDAYMYVQYMHVRMLGEIYLD